MDHVIVVQGAWNVNEINIDPLEDGLEYYVSVRPLHYNGKRRLQCVGIAPVADLAKFLPW